MLMLPGLAQAQAPTTLLVEGGVTIPAGSLLSFTPLLAFTNGTKGLESLDLRAPQATLHLFERPFTEADAAGLNYKHLGGTDHTPLKLRNLHLRAGEVKGNGYLGMYPDRASLGHFTPLIETTLQPQEQSRITTKVMLLHLGDEEPDRFARHYDVSVQEPHMDWSAPGTLRYEGDGAIKVFGVDLIVESAELAGTFRTGIERESDFALREGAFRWALIEFTNGTMEATSATPWRLDATQVDVRGEGHMTMLKVRHDAGASPSAPHARRATDRLEGQLDATLTVQRAAAGLFTRVDVRQGTLASAAEAAPPSAQSTRAVAPGPAAWPLPLLGLALVLAGGGAAGAYAALRRREPHMPFSPEDCREAGAAAASEEDWALAAEWFERGAKLAPTSARMHADLAFALSQIGDHDGALRHYATASRHSQDGEADFNGALAAIAAGRPPEEVETWLARALRRSPEYVLHIEDDEEFDPLRDRPAYRRIVATAWREVERRGVG